MATVRSRDTRPEVAVRRALHAAGLRYRLHAKGVPGRPDIVFRSRKIAVFVHGCFWHRHLGCKATRTPKTRADFWTTKFEENVSRDQRVEATLEAAGWRVLVVWECETKSRARLEDIVAEIRSLPAKPSRIMRTLQG